MEKRSTDVNEEAMQEEQEERKTRGEPWEALQEDPRMAKEEEEEEEEED
jgi:hypothetical protein